MLGGYPTPNARGGSIPDRPDLWTQIQRIDSFLTGLFGRLSFGLFQAPTIGGALAGKVAAQERAGAGFSESSFGNYAPFAGSVTGPAAGPDLAARPPVLARLELRVPGGFEQPFEVEQARRRRRLAYTPPPPVRTSRLA